jgi:SAM-dependent methyltransferase
MHDTAYVSGSLFAQVYGKAGMSVLDVGGQDVNGTLRKPFEGLGMKYISLDIEAGKNVDVVMKPGEEFPFPDESFDLIVSTSCFEHDPCFWMTFREICRVLKKGGYFYVNAPSNGPYHGWPGDNWRFYADAGQALVYWSGKKIDGKVYPVRLEETFFIDPCKDIWRDFVAIWKRVDEIDEIDENILCQIKDKIGPLEQSLSRIIQTSD